ncbi:heterokaryon incompatibility protein-domain-containing protein [Cercophora scortea]|uniref:Heterokaryon incompatibility protein-domain-containing protein n=1 Tax=Cercophora scortea TaxID=314031 RepID=A0AAE0J2K3_9PEZI|nr:heterokaryon incompatibility protein-domain-containing protein [Cercophora scortea]
MPPSHTRRFSALLNTWFKKEVVGQAISSTSTTARRRSSFCGRESLKFLKPDARKLPTSNIPARRCLPRFAPPVFKKTPAPSTSSSHCFDRGVSRSLDYAIVFGMTTIPPLLVFALLLACVYWDSQLEPSVDRQQRRAIKRLLKTDPGTSTTSTDIYHDLKPGEFRVLLLEPGKGNDTVCCRLFVCRLSDEVPYEALSYAWGDATKTRLIICDGQPLRVANNLYHALRSLRHVARPRLLWIDALCINQENVVERGHQVKEMRHIYSNGARTLVWLGCNDDAEPNDVFAPLHDAFGRWCAMTLFDLLYLIRRWVDDEFLFQHKRNINDRSGVWDWIGFTTGSRAETPRLTSYFEGGFKGLEGLLQQPWFTRLWVIQEVAHARRIVVMYGGTSVAWEWLAAVVNDFARAGLVHESRNERARVGAGAVVEMERARLRVQNGNKQDLLRVLLATNAAECSDLRDKIYGVLSLAKSDENGGDSESSQAIFSDYSLDLPEVFRRVARWHIDNGDLDILSCTTRRDTADTEERKDLDKLPSWVPDWARIDNTSPFVRYFERFPYPNDDEEDALELFNKTQAIVPKSAVTPHDELILHGRRVCVIEAVGPPSCFRMSINFERVLDMDVLALNRAWLRDCESLVLMANCDNTDVGDGSTGYWQYALGTTVTAGLSASGTVAPFSHSAVAEYREWLDGMVGYVSAPGFLERIHNNTSEAPDMLEWYMENTARYEQEFREIEASIATWSAHSPSSQGSVGSLTSSVDVFNSTSSPPPDQVPTGEHMELARADHPVNGRCLTSFKHRYQTAKHDDGSVHASPLALSTDITPAPAFLGGNGPQKSTSNGSFRGPTDSRAPRETGSTVENIYKQYLPSSPNDSSSSGEDHKTATGSRAGLSEQDDRQSRGSDEASAHDEDIDTHYRLENKRDTQPLQHSKTTETVVPIKDRWQMYFSAGDVPETPLPELPMLEGSRHESLAVPTNGRDYPISVGPSLSSVSDSQELLNGATRDAQGVGEYTEHGQVAFPAQDNDELLVHPALQQSLRARLQIESSNTCGLSNAGFSSGGLTSDSDEDPFRYDRGSYTLFLQPSREREVSVALHRNVSAASTLHSKATICSPETSPRREANVPPVPPVPQLLYREPAKAPGEATKSKNPFFKKLDLQLYQKGDVEYDWDAIDDPNQVKVTVQAPPGVSSPPARPDSGARVDNTAALGSPVNGLIQESRHAIMSEGGDWETVGTDVGYFDSNRACASSSGFTGGRIVKTTGSSIADYSDDGGWPAASFDGFSSAERILQHPTNGDIPSSRHLRTLKDTGRPIFLPKPRIHRVNGYPQNSCRLFTDPTSTTSGTSAREYLVEKVTAPFRSNSARKMLYNRQNPYGAIDESSKFKFRGSFRSTNSDEKDAEEAGAVANKAEQRQSRYDKINSRRPETPAQRASFIDGQEKGRKTPSTQAREWRGRPDFHQQHQNPKEFKRSLIKSDPENHTANTAWGNYQAKACSLSPADNSFRYPGQRREEPDLYGLANPNFGGAYGTPSEDAYLSWQARKKRQFYYYIMCAMCIFPFTFPLAYKGTFDSALSWYTKGEVASMNRRQRRHVLVLGIFISCLWLCAIAVTVTLLASRSNKGSRY